MSLASGRRPQQLNNSGQSDEAFVEAIHTMAAHLKDAEAVADEILTLFFQLAGSRDGLPTNSSKDTIDALLTSLVAMIGFNTGQPLAVRALEVLFKFIKNDEATFKRFKPSQAVLRRLNLDAIIGSDSVKDSDLGLDFATFLLRYYRNVGYGTFSADENIQSRIKRAETYRAWADIEDLAHGYEKLSGNFTSHQKTVSAAFREVNQFIERLRAEVQAGQKSVTDLNSNNQRLNAMDLGQDGASMMQQMAANIQDMTSSIKQHSVLIGNIQAVQNVNVAQPPAPGPTSDLSTDKIASKIDIGANVKEQMKDMLEVINLLKDEQDSRAGQMRTKIDSIQQLVGQSAAKSMREVEMAMEPLQHDVAGLKDKDFSAGKEYEYMLKNATQRMSDEVSKVQEDLRRLRLLNEQEALRTQVSVIEQELVDVKNMYRIPLQRGSQAPLDRDTMAVISEEMSEIWSFMQRFIDEHAVNMVQDIRQEDINLTRKMDWMDWLSRNAEFFSPEAISKCLVAFKTLYNFEDVAQRNAYIKAKHQSNAVITVGNLVTHAAQLTRSEDTKARIAILLSIYEPLLINDLNLEKAMMTHERVVETLIEIARLPEAFIRAVHEVENDAEIRSKVPAYLKYAIRCLTSCIRSNDGLHRLVNSDGGISQVIEFLDLTHDEEIQANCAKILRISLRDEVHFDRVTSGRRELGNMLLRNLGIFLYSDIVAMELLAALRNLSRSPPQLQFVQHEYLGTLVQVAKMPANEKIQQVAIQTLNNISALPELDKQIQVLGGPDLYLVMKGDANKFNFQQ